MVSLRASNDNITPNQSIASVTVVTNQQSMKTMLVRVQLKSKIEQHIKELCEQRSLVIASISTAYTRRQEQLNNLLSNHQSPQTELLASTLRAQLIYDKVRIIQQINFKYSQYIQAITAEFSLKSTMIQAYLTAKAANLDKIKISLMKDNNHNDKNVDNNDILSKHNEIIDAQSDKKFDNKIKRVSTYSATKSRNHSTFGKKRHYITKYESEKKMNPGLTKKKFASDNGLSYRTFDHMFDKKRYNEIMDPSLTQQDLKSRKSRQWRKKQSQGRYPEIQTKVYKKIIHLRLKKGVRIDGIHIKLTMLHLLRKYKPKGYKKFCASDGWLNRWLKRHKITLQSKTNKKHKSIEERLPAVSKFHQFVIYGVNNRNSDRDPKYGRFSADNRYHVDQVGGDFAQASKKTYNPQGYGECWIQGI